jgi:hypothetical protein
MPIELAAILQSALGLFLLWYVLCFLWRDYFVDAFREELFAARDELFNYVTVIGLSYEDEKHTFLRNFINSMIRFSHRLTFFRLVLAAVSKSRHPTMYSNDLLERWNRALELLPPDQKVNFQGMMGRVMRAAALHMVWRSPLVLPVVVVYKIGSMLNAAAVYSIKRLVYDKIRLGLQEQEVEEQPLQGDRNSRERLAAV